mgnify:CR=1 FL=1|jgi:hypothetical protein
MDSTTPAGQQCPPGQSSNVLPSEKGSMESMSSISAFPPIVIIYESEKAISFKMICPYLVHLFEFGTDGREAGHELVQPNFSQVVVSFLRSVTLSSDTFHISCSVQEFGLASSILSQDIQIGLGFTNILCIVSLHRFITRNITDPLVE